MVYHNIIGSSFIEDTKELILVFKNMLLCQHKYGIANFEIIVSLRDQSERREMNYLMRGNNIFSLQFGCVAHIGDLV